MRTQDITTRLLNRTCGNISCDQCNDDREAAAEEIILLRRENERLKTALRDTAEALMHAAQ